MATTKYVDINGLSRFKANFQSLLTNKFGDLKYYKHQGSFMTMFFLYSGNYDYGTSIDDKTFASYLSSIILNIATVSYGNYALFKENIESDNELSRMLKSYFSKLMNALTEDSYCICNYRSASAMFMHNENYASVTIGDIGVVYEISDGEESLSAGRFENYYAGTNISIVDGTINNTLDVSGKENTSNKVTTLSSSSTDTQYPSAKCVYDLVGNIESLLQEV